MKKLIALLLMLITLLSLTGCGVSEKLGVYAPTVECGKYYRIPDLVGVKDEVKYFVLDPDGKKVQVRSGSFQMMKVGGYTITYEYGGKSKTYTVECTPDVSAPVMTEPLEVYNIYYVGETYMPYGGELFDPSELDYTVCYKYSYYYEDETEPLKKVLDIDGNETNDLYIDRAGKYKIVVPAKDMVGNVTEFVYSFTAVEIFNDTTLTDKQIANFNHDGYLQYISSSNVWGDAPDDFVITSDYPDAPTNTENKVLKAASPGKYSPYYDFKYQFMTEVAVSDIKYVFIRFCAVRKTGYNTAGTTDFSSYPFMLYSVPYSNLDSQIAKDLITDGVGYSFALADGAWSVARIPVSYLLSEGEETLKGIHLCTSATLYIDEIWYSNEDFTDVNLQTDVVADFDEYEYLFQVSKNKMGDTPAITVLSEGYPKATEGNGVLKVSTTSPTANSAVDIKLFKRVNVKDYKYVNFRVYYDGRIDGSLVIKTKLVFMYHELKDFYNEKIYLHYVTDTNAGNYQALWTDITVPSSIFVKHDGDYALEEEFDTLSFLFQGTVYIDKIWLSN